MLTIGDRFPVIPLTSVVSTERGKEFATVSTETYPGKWKVVFFWPMDFTFICPTEIAEFGKKNQAFADRDAQVLGGSTDTHYVHLAWRKDHPIKPIRTMSWSNQAQVVTLSRTEPLDAAERETTIDVDRW